MENLRYPVADSQPTAQRCVPATFLTADERLYSLMPKTAQTHIANNFEQP